MTALTNHFLFEFKTGLRNPSAMMVNYLLPLGFYALMGFVMVAINPGYAEIILPSMIFTAVIRSMVFPPYPSYPFQHYRQVFMV
jgi:ABC-2 type transport system permease protein